MACRKEFERAWERRDSIHECLERVSSDGIDEFWVWTELERETEGGRVKEQCMVVTLIYSCYISG